MLMKYQSLDKRETIVKPSWYHVEGQKTMEKCKLMTKVSTKNKVKNNDTFVFEPENVQHSYKFWQIWQKVLTEKLQ